MSVMEEVQPLTTHLPLTDSSMVLPQTMKDFLAGLDPESSLIWQASLMPQKSTDMRLLELEAAVSALQVELAEAKTLIAAYVAIVQRLEGKRK